MAVSKQMFWFRVVENPLIHPHVKSEIELPVFPNLSARWGCSQSGNLQSPVHNVERARWQIETLVKHLGANCIPSLNVN